MNSRHFRPTAAALTGCALALAGLAVAPASGVNADHGNVVVSATPATFTPHVMDGSVNALTQVGNKIIAAGTFTSVSPSATFSNKADDVTRNRIFAFDATTGAIDATFNPNLGGSANSLTTDGTYIYVGGSFGSVGGSSSIKRVVKLTSSGAVVSAFNAVPNKSVNEVVLRGSRLYLGGGFTSIRSGTVTTTRNALAAVDPTTGSVLAGVNVPFTGVYDPNNGGGGSTNVKRFDVTPDGSRLAAIGNFATVGGQPRSQLAVLDTGGATATLAPWFTNRYDRAHNSCARVFDTFTRDIDFSPDGSYFVVSTTGAFAGGVRQRHDVRHRQPLGDGQHRQRPDVDRLHRRRHDVRRRHHRQRRVRRRPHALAEQPLPGRPGRTGCRAAGGHRGAGPRQRAPAVVEPRPLARRGRPGAVRDQPGALGRQRHDVDRGQEARTDRPDAACRRLHDPDRAAATLPNDLFVAQIGPAARVSSSDGPSTPAAPRPARPARRTRRWTGRRVRGGFLLNGTIYYGLADGGFYKRTFNAGTGATGAQQTVNLYDDPDNGARIPFAIASMTGAFYDPATHRIYYTVSGSSSLYYRYFTPESEVVGAQTFQADAGGVNFSAVAGMTLASGRILYGSSVDGALRSAPFAGGRVTGGASTVSSDGTWRYRAILVPNG